MKNIVYISRQRLLVTQKTGVLCNKMKTSRSFNSSCVYCLTMPAKICAWKSESFFWICRYQEKYKTTWFLHASRHKVFYFSFLLTEQNKTKNISTHIFVGINKENKSTKYQEKINPARVRAPGSFHISFNFWSLRSTT